MATWRPSGITGPVSGRLAGIKCRNHGGNAVIAPPAAGRPPPPPLSLRRSDLVRYALAVPPADWPGGEAYWTLLAAAATRVTRFGRRAPVTARQLWIHWASYYRATPGIFAAAAPATPSRAPQASAPPSGFFTAGFLTLEAQIPPELPEAYAWFFLRIRKGTRRGYGRGLVFMDWGQSDSENPFAVSFVSPAATARFGTLQPGNVAEIGVVIGPTDGSTLPSRMRTSQLTL